MTTTAENLLLEQMQKLDRQIEETDRDLVHMNKQVGKKMSKLSDLKAERRKLSDAYKNLSQNITTQQEQPVVGLTMREVK